MKITKKRLGAFAGAVVISAAVLLPASMASAATGAPPADPTCTSKSASVDGALLTLQATINVPAGLTGNKVHSEYINPGAVSTVLPDQTVPDGATVFNYTDTINNVPLPATPGSFIITFTSAEGGIVSICNGSVVDVTPAPSPSPTPSDPPVINAPKGVATGADAPTPEWVMVNQVLPVLFVSGLFGIVIGGVFYYRRRAAAK